jgi:serine/threonine-protein kinase
MSVGIGSQVAGIRLVSLIGHGGMAIVYLGRREGTGEELVVKVLRDEYTRDDHIRRRFTRESGYASSLEHPHIVRVLDSGEQDGTSYIVMPYVPGQDLRQRLAVDGRLDPAETIGLLSKVADALDTAHDSGLWHRDVKPGNVLIASGQGPDPPGHCYLTDFGLSKQPGRDSRGLTAPGDFVGSVLYTAPEQMLGEQTDQTLDVYSLGCVLYECLAGSPPFGGVSASDVMQAHIEAQAPRISKQQPDLPSALDVVLQRALAKRPADRYRTCGELIEAAREALGVAGAVPIQAEAPSRISLRLEFDFDASEARIQLDAGPPSIRVTRDHEQWHLAAD